MGLISEGGIGKSSDASNDDKTRQDIHVSRKKFLEAREQTQKAIARLYEDTEQQKLETNKFLKDVSKKMENVDSSIARSMALVTAVKTNEGLWEEVAKYITENTISAEDEIGNDSTLKAALERSSEIFDMFMQGRTTAELTDKIDHVIALLEDET